MADPLLLPLPPSNQVIHQSAVSGASAGFSAFMVFAAYGLVVYFGGHEINNGWTTFNNMLIAFMVQGGDLVSDDALLPD